MEKRFVICSAMAIFASVAIASGVLRTNTSTPAEIGVPEAAFAVGDEFTVTPFSDVSFALKIVSAPPAGIAGQSFIARDVNGSASAVVKATKTGWRITIDDFENRRQYSLRCKGGVVTVTETDTTPEGPDECGTCGGQIEAPAVEATSATKLKAATPKLLSTTTDENAFEIAEHKSVVDILVAFDKRAKEWAESEWGSIEECADAAIQRMNGVLVNTHVDDLFFFRLVGVTEIDAEYKTITNDMLNQLRYGAAPFEKISALREYYGADIVTVLVNVDEEHLSSYTTGIANGLYGLTDSDMSGYVTSQYGFNICHIRRTFREYTMAHETGHCMGCGHSNSNDGFSKPQSATYSCGYHFTAKGKRYRTVMGYSSAQGYYWEAAPYFSTPEITPEEYDVPIGTAISNDNRRVLRESCAGVSAYREHVIPYDWDVRFLDKDGNELRDGRIFEDSMNVTLGVASEYSEAKIYLTLDGTTPDKTSLPYKPYATIPITATTTLTASIVVDGVAQSVRSVTLVKGTTPSVKGGEGLVWDTNGKYPWSLVSAQGWKNPITDWTNGTASVLHNYNFGSNFGQAFRSSLSTSIEGPKRLYFRHQSNFSSLSDYPLSQNMPWARFTVVCEGGGVYASNESSIVWRRDYIDIPEGEHRVIITYSQGQSYFQNQGVWLDDIQLAENQAEVTLSPRDVTSFTGSIPVTLSADTEGQTIYYTTDGSEPTLSSSVYNGNLSIDGNCTIKAIAVDASGRKSAVFSSNYRTTNKDDINMGERFGDASRVWSNCPQNEWGQSGTSYVLSHPIDKGALHNHTWLGTIVEGSHLMEFTYKTYFVGGNRFAVTIDGEEVFSDTNGSSSDVTQTVSVPAGTHDVRFVLSQHSMEVPETPIKKNWVFIKGVKFTETDSLVWSGESGQNGNGRWMDNSAVFSWNDSADAFANERPTIVTFGNIDGAQSPVVTVKGSVVPNTVAFTATSSEYTFAKGDDEASITLPDDSFRPSGNVTFNVPVKMQASEFYVETDKSYTFNAPFGPEAAATSGSFAPSTPIIVGARSTLTVAPGSGNVQTFEKFNNTGTYWNTSKFIVGEGTVRFTGANNGGSGLFGSLKLEVENGGNLVFENGDATGYSMDKSFLTIKQGGTVTYNTRDSLRRTVNFEGGKILLKGASSGRGLDLMNGLTLNVSADSQLDCDTSNNSNAKYVYMRGGSPSFVFSNNAKLVNNVVYVGNDTSTGGINLSGVGTFVQNGFGSEALTYSGATEIGGGVTLELNAEHQNAGAYTVAGGARLTGTGSIAGNGIVDLSASNAKLCGSLSVKNLSCANGAMIGDPWNSVSATVTGSLSTKTDGANITVTNGYLAIAKDCDVSGFATANLTINGAALELGTSLTVSTLYANTSTITLSNGASLIQTGSRSLDCSKLKIILKDVPLDETTMLIAPGGFANLQQLDIVGLPSGSKLNYDINSQRLYYTESQPETPAVVDVLVAYDNGAYNYVTSRSRTLEEFAETQIERMNDVLVTNKLDRFYSYRLAGVCRVNEGYSDINNVATLVAEGEGPCASLRAAREMYGADTVTLLVNTSGSTLGNSLQIDYREDVSGQHDCAFSVCAISAVDSNSQYTMIHENAHTMGCGHAREQFTAEDLALDPEKYSYGYYFTDENSVTRHTIMAYGNDASPYFSTTSSEFGYNLGNRTNNNARVLKETCADVSRWRENVMPFDNEAIVTVDGTGEEVVSGRMFANQISIRLASQIEGAEIYYSLNGIDPTYEEVENVDESEYVYPYTSDYPVINIKADKTLSVALKPAGADYILPVRRVKFIRCDLLANASDAAWQTSLKFPWTTEDETIRSCNHTDYSSKNKKCTTPLKATIVGPKRLSFSHKSYFGGTDVTDSNYSHFDVLLDDSPVLAQTECYNDWTEAYVDVPEGTHEVTFVFSQRYAMNNTEGDNKGVTPEADDAVWLKDIVLADPVEPAESDVADVIFSNTNASPDQASWTISGNPTLTIPAKPADGIINGTLIKIQSLDFGYAGEDNKDGAHAKKIAITDGTTTWTSASVVTNTTDTFPYKNNTTHDRLVYSFVDADCILAVGTDYTLKLLDASGDEMSSIRYVLVSGGASIVSGMDFTSSNTTYTPMMQLKGEVAKTSCFDWTPGGAPTGWFTLWGGENLGGTHEKIGPDGLTTNLYVTFHESNDDEDKWHPWNGNAAAMGDYTFLVYGNIDEVNPASGKLGVLWDMGFSGNQKTVLVKDSAGNVKLVQANGNTITRCINAGPVEGYHLFTVRFSEANGASLQIDDGVVYPDCTFTQISGTGLQVGSILGGLSGAFARGDGFAVLKMMAFDTDSIPAWQYKLLCEEYPAVINHVLITVDNVEYYRLKYAIQNLEENDLFSVTDDVVIDFDARTISSPISGESYTFAELGQGLTLSDNGDGTYSLVSDIAETPVLRISEIMPKPTDDRNPGQREGMDVNGLESGWVEVENTSDQWADLKDYRFTRTNRGKKSNQADYGNFPSRLVPPHGRAIFYTSERYSNSKSQKDSAFASGKFNGKPAIFEDHGNILVWGDKVNPKKSPFVRLYYMPNAETTNVVDTVVIPSDLPEGWSIIVGDARENEGTRRWMCPTPTRGEANTPTDGLKRIGPNVGPLYEITTLKKTEVENEFALPVPPAKPNEDYAITVAVNPVMNPNGTFKPRAKDAIKSLRIVYRSNLDDSTLATNDVDLATKDTDKKAWGDKYTAYIPQTALPAAGHLVQWKFLIEDDEGTVWTSPSFNNPDDGYEWYGTIVEPTADQMSAKLPTWHMFAVEPHLTQMDKDKDDQNKNQVPNYARIAIYDSSISNYYDYVRIDLRGHTSATFKKKGHGLRFAKAHPLTMMDIVSGEQIKEIRKTSLISEYADPSYMRQMVAFWLWRKMDNKVPFDFPVRCNLNGEFYQLAFNSERFTDELIEDVYEFDKYGYSYKNVGTLNKIDTSAGKIEKKTPDDENETDTSVLKDFLVDSLKAKGAADSHSEESADLTKFVVEKFNLPAWINYLASARITQEMDDVWANVCAYYDNAEMEEGVRGTDTWMPLGYDFNLSFGQFYIDDLADNSLNGLTATNDWFKSHPLYGGWTIRARKSEGGKEMDGNNGFEAVLQSPKFRRLFLRRLRTLMDQELKEPGTLEGTTPFIFEMRKLANLMRDDAALDKSKYPNDESDDAIDVWRNIPDERPADMDAGIDEIWSDYVIPRRQHLYVTHSITNTAWEVGYAFDKNAGIPEAQSPFEDLIVNITVDTSNLDKGVVVISNGNDEVVDMSGWTLNTGKKWTLPSGTVCDSNDCIYVVADRRAYIEANKATLTDQVIIGNATFGTAAAENPLAYPASDTSSGTVSISEEPVVFEAETKEEAAAWVESLTPELTAEQKDDGLSTDYFTVEAKKVPGESGKYQAVINLNPAKESDLKPEFAEPSPTEEEPVAIEDDEDGKKTVTITLQNAVKGLWYGYEVSDALGEAFANDNDSFEKATGATFRMKKSTPRENKASGFFRVKVLPAKPKP